ncbi:MAG: 16S rRNA (cytosine(1402)-N(4))-methyltransferase [Bacteroidia bacterium]|nr:MAG: 16S rRNA (cytosine(1402)-N(4))-methyltransferase [Bacteroidia bacterium]PIE86418.1 MAG: 16S rRNA (cytosine(1402)-N(4))-methyltransferase [Bacteroidia bacterium]
MSEYHIPVLLKESIEGLNINPNGIYVDATFGGGGHSREILSKLDKGKLIAFDQDSDSQANSIEDERFILIQHNFRYLRNFLRYHKIAQIDGLLADLGISSHHINTPERGFSFRFDAELDMRMNQNTRKTAKEVINSYESSALMTIFKEYGEIKNAKKLTEQICVYREKQKIERIADFVEIIKNLIPVKYKNKYLAQIFQALRIEVNDEMAVLKKMLQQTVGIIKENGRLVLISYHSLEDRLVKNFIRSGTFDGKVEKDLYGNYYAPFEAVNRKVIVPNEDELKENKRARSAKLRIARRTKEVENNG